MPDYERLIKALQVCGSEASCNSCPEPGGSDCQDRLVRDAASVIQDLWGENRRQEAIIQTYKNLADAKIAINTFFNSLVDILLEAEKEGGNG